MPRELTEQDRRLAEQTRRYERYMSYARACEQRARRANTVAECNGLRDAAQEWRARAYHEVA